MNFTTTNVKSNKIAEAIRAKGYKMFQNGHLYEALLKFNKSLCTAEAGTKTMGLIYMNRAEAFFKLKLYENCLNNIQLARADYCTIEGNKLLTELEEKCLELNDVNAERENPWEFFKLTYPPNKKLPYVVDCLEVKTDKKYGRYIITNQAFNVGDIIAIEKPFFKLIKTDPEDDQYPETNLYQYCANCLEDNLMDLIPCPRCLSTMFCSNLCQRTANKGFHHYECQILDLLNETGDWRMVLRSFFDALSICDGSVEEMRRLMDESDELSPSVFNFDFSKPENVETAKNKLKCLIGLERKVDVEMKDLSNIFLQHQELAEIWSSHSAFVNKFLERMMQIEILNFHEIIGKSLNNCYRSCLGDGAYVFCSLLNHSCCPNTMRIVVENRMVLVVERPIKKGEQLFDCYIGDCFYFKSRNLRREELMDYQFICECDACEKDFPEVLNGELEPVDKSLNSLAQKIYAELRDPRKILTPERAKDLAVKYSSIMQANYKEENYPCREIVLLQLSIIRCFLAACKSTISFP